MGLDETKKGPGSCWFVSNTENARFKKGSSCFVKLDQPPPSPPPAQPLLPIILLPRLPTPASPRSLMSSAKWSMQSRDSVSHTLVVVEQTDEDRVEEA